MEVKSERKFASNLKIEIKVNQMEISLSLQFVHGFVHLEFPFQCHRVLICCCRGSMKLNWFAGIKGEWQQCALNWMKILMCTWDTFLPWQIYISEISIHIPIRYVYKSIGDGMHCITIRWCLKIWQSKIVTWFSTNNNDMRSTQNNFFFSFLVLGYWFSLTQFPSIPPIFASTFSSELSKKRWRWRCNMIKLDVTNGAFQL